MDKRIQVGKLDMEHVPPWPLLISAPRLGREFIRPSGPGTVKLVRRGGTGRGDDAPPRIGGPMDLREIPSQ